MDRISNSDQAKMLLTVIELANNDPAKMHVAFTELAKQDKDLLGLYGLWTLLKEALAAIHFFDIVDNYFSRINVGATLGACVQSISTIYRQSLGDTKTRPNWIDVSNRRAYIGRFFVMHSHMVYRGLQKSLADHKCIIDNWRRQGRFHVCCIGGGPGSDAVGVVKFLQDSYRPTPVTRFQCTIFDLYVDWKSEWDSIQETNSAKLPVNMTYLRSDMKSQVAGLCPTGLNAVRSAEIVTMIKSFSPVAAFVRRDPAHGNQLRQVFQEMKPGALVLYIDNRYGSQHEEFRAIARSGGVRDCLFEWHGQLDIVSTLGISASVRRISGRIGVEPMTSCSVSIMLLRKQRGGL